MRAHTLADKFPLTVTGRYCLDFNAHGSGKYKNTVWKKIDICQISRTGRKHDPFQGCSSGNIGRKASIHGPAAPANRLTATIRQSTERGCRDMRLHGAYVVVAWAKGRHEWHALILTINIRATISSHRRTVHFFMGLKTTYYLYDTKIQRENELFNVALRVPQCTSSDVLLPGR